MRFRLPYWLCNRLGHNYVMVNVPGVNIARPGERRKTLPGRYRCTRCVAEHRVVGPDWRTW